jgi:hypothetical protein
MKKIVVWSIGIFLSLGLGHQLGAENIRISGSYKNFSIFFSMPDFLIGGQSLDSDSLGAVNNRFRLRALFKPWEGVEFKMAYDLSPRIQDPLLFQESLFSPGTVSPGYRITDFRERIYPVPKKSARSFGLFHNLDRFMVTKRFKWADLYIGRQAVAWGSARMINPTDIIAPFSFNQLDTEERRGVDAVRLRIPLGMMDELDLGVVAGHDFKTENSAAFVRCKFYVWQTDVSLLSLAFRHHLLLGFDLARAIGGAGLWCETALVLPYLFEKAPLFEEDQYFRLSLGMDTNLTSKLYGYVEYHFSSAGSKQAREYLNLFSTSAFQDGSVYLMGKHYLGIGGTYQISPLVPGTLMILFNASDQSLILAPLIEYNAAPDIYLSAGCYVGLGSGLEPSLEEGSGAQIMGSEFGTYPDMVFTSFRIYF